MADSAEVKSGEVIKPIEIEIPDVGGESILRYENKH